MTDTPFEGIIKYKERFGQISWKHLSKCIKAFESNETLSFAIWASVFTESLLKDIIFSASGMVNGTDELSNLINKIKNLIKNGSKFEVPKEDVLWIEDITRRSDEIRLKRNRLVHDVGIDNANLANDAQDIRSNIEQIIMDYLETSISNCISIPHEIKEEKHSQLAPTFRMFLSTITPHSFEQREFIEDFCLKLKKIGVDPVRCTLTQFDRKDPMSKVRDTISKCEGIIVLGLERSHIYYNKDREGSEKETEATHRRYSSSWLQLEAGMAVGLRKQVFVLCQENLFPDGIFDMDWNSFTPIQLSLPLNIDEQAVDLFLDQIKSFKNEREMKDNQ